MPPSGKPKLMHRPYRPLDKGAVLRIFEANVPRFILPHERTDFAAFLDGLPHTGYYVVMEDEEGKVVACGGFSFRQEGEAELCWGMVDPEYQGLGIGGSLRLLRMQLMTEIPNLKKVRLSTSQNDAPFFESYGFKIVQVVPDGYGKHMHKVDMEVMMDDITHEAISAQSRLEVR
jgi:N-acetylglutamate synthase-like GNAT family acetyltransferase